MTPRRSVHPLWMLDLLRLWIPTMILVSAMLFLLYYQERSHRTERIEARHDAQISEASAILGNRLAAVVRDIRYLAGTQHLEEYLSERTALDRESQLLTTLAEDWRRFMATRPTLYDQIRFLDRDGRERVRINNRRGLAQRVPEAELQQKFDRYYVQEARSLPGDTIYLSRLDLNVEHGVVEQPIKPMLRLLTAPLQGRLQDSGLLVLNVLAQPILERLRSGAAGNSPSQIWLLDSQGYWLLGDAPNQEWGFMLPDRRQFRLASAHPALHAELQASPPGEQPVHRQVNGGIFSYQRYDPGADTAGQLSRGNLHGSAGEYWTIARWSPATEINAAMAPFVARLSWLGGTLVLLVSLGSGCFVWLNRRRVEALAAERETAATLDHFIDSAPDALVVSDGRGRIVLVNQLAESSLGYAPGELPGQPIEVLVPERLRDQHPALRGRYLADPQSRAMGGGVITIRRKDGSEYPVSISLNAIPGRDGVRVISAIRDITALQQAEASLRDSNARILAAHQATEQANHQLLEANDALEAFAYSVSHDLRTPLRSIEGFSVILLRRYADRLDDAGQDYLQRMRAASQRMERMIDEILTLSRIGRCELQCVPVDLSAQAAELVGQLREVAPTRQVEVVIAPGLVAEADPTLMRVALDNLIGNAWKYTGKTDRARIEFGCAARDGSMEYFVRDNGVGFDMAHAGKLFVAFERLHTTKDFQGNGIGLATVQRVLARHGGHIRAEAAVGEGACFYFTLGPSPAEAAHG